MREIESGVITAAEASRVHGIASSVIFRWQNKYREGTLTEGPTGREKMLEKENRELKEKLGELYMQIEVLKKIQNINIVKCIAIKIYLSLVLLHMYISHCLHKQY
jgi:transposase-like protein